MVLAARKFFLFAFIFCALCSLFSCSEEKFLFFNAVKVKNYPDTPFVYSNKINISGSVNKDEKTRLEENLVNYWADSLYARRVQKLAVLYTLKKPSVFDTTTLSTTQSFMNGYLFSQGYFNAILKDTFYIDTFYKSKPPQYRTTVVMNIDVGKQVIIDSFAYHLVDSLLQKIAINNSKNSKIIAGKTLYSQDIISAELDRLVNLYRNNGYFLLHKENLAALVDTTNASLLKLTLDPFEQAELIEQAAAKRKENPTATVLIEQKRFADTTKSNNNDSSFLKRFYIGNVYIYPETQITQFPDSILHRQDDYKQFRNRGFTMLYNHGMFKPKVFRNFNYLRTGRLYDDDLFYKSINAYNQVGAWKQVDTRTIIRGDSVDLHYFLYPDSRQNITYNLEASRNTGDILSSSNFFGLALNITYLNRNVWKQAVQSSTSFTNGVELTFNKQENQSNSYLQAFQISLGQTYTLPRAFIPFKIKKLGRLDYGRTIISANASYSDRQDYFRIRSFVADYGYNWKYKNKVWQFRFPNIELYSLDTLPKLVEAFNENPFLRNSFNTGYVISAQGNLTITYKGKGNITNYASFSAEESGVPFFNGPKNKIYQYLKAVAEYRKNIPFGKTSLAFRALAGIGYNYSSSGRFGKTLPFFKQFIAGGPNSMRAWPLRQLGLGSSLLSDTSSTFKDRYGDMQLETNIEYRYPLIHYSSVNINGALFVDAGNIWNVRKDSSNPNSEFNINRFGKDVAIGVGTGLRLDFHYFLIRVDMGIKLKDPARLENDGWLDVANFSWRNNEFQKYDANGKAIPPYRNNYAVQLGIGLPF